MKIVYHYFRKYRPNESLESNVENAYRVEYKMEIKITAWLSDENERNKFISANEKIKQYCLMELRWMGKNNGILISEKAVKII